MVNVWLAVSYLLGLSLFVFHFCLFFCALTYLLFANVFCLLKFIENSTKRKFGTSDNYLFKSHFRYELINFRKMFLTFMLRFKLFDF